jgi:multiple sugar transport system permease protein
MGSKARGKFNTAFYHIFVAIIGFIMIYPLLWMIMSSFKENSQIFKQAGSLFPKVFRIENYINGWKGFGGVGFDTFFKNSLFICLMATIGATISSALVSYGFARCKFRFKKIWFSAMLVTVMLPFQVIMVPQFVIFQNIGWVGTYLPLIVPYFFGQAFFIFLIMQFIQGIPHELDEAAKIDGCSIYGVFFRIILPLVVPAIVTSALFSFIWRWDDFLAAMLYLNKPARYPVTLALRLFSDPTTQSDWGALFAMATLSLVPVFIIFFLFQKYLVEGIATTGLKS